MSPKRLAHVLSTFLAVSSAIAQLGAAPARAADEGVEEIVSVLRAKGLIDDAQKTEILAKHVVSQQKNAGASALSGVQFFGDFRLRWEAFHFDRDAFGTEAENQSRSRYRLRLGARKQVNDQVAVVFRVASGFADPCCTDQTLGDAADFTPDPLIIDRTFVELSLPESSDGLAGKLLAGRTPNPFTWDKGPDSLVYHPDLNLEGASLQLKLPLLEDQVWLFANAGGYLVQQRTTRSDTKLIGLQLGAGYRPLGGVELGLRASSYLWRSLQFDDIGGGSSSFIHRARLNGNLPNAFRRERRARIGELAGYLQYALSDDWPVLVWGNMARNFTASSAVVSGLATGPENSGYGAGLQLGDASKFLSLGLAFFRIESNAVIAQFTDRDFFDGLTNAEGYAIYLTRALWPHVELRVAFYNSDSLHNRGSQLANNRLTNAFTDSLVNHNRRRIQTNLVVSF